MHAQLPQKAAAAACRTGLGASKAGDHRAAIPIINIVSMVVNRFGTYSTSMTTKNCFFFFSSNRT